MPTNQRMVALLLPFFALLVSACTSKDSTPSEVATCMPLSESDGSGWEIMARTLSSEGRELTYVRRSVVLDDDAAGLQIETTIEADGQLVVSIDEQAGSERVEFGVDYGSLVPGFTSTMLVVENETLSGTVNGRAIVPMPVAQADPSMVRFEDGEPPPDSGIDPDIDAALPELFELASSAAQKCVEMSGAAEGGSAVVDKRGDRGHVSLPAFSSGCIKCKGGCAAGQVACALGGFSCATLGWPANIICIAIEETSCLAAYLTCISACKATGAPCCPVGCGGGCCEDQETCINPAERLCCGPGQSTCLGTECCDSVEVCIDSGPIAGTCCDPMNHCGDACCKPTDACLPEVSLCCSAEQTPCVDKCCDTAGCIDTGPNPGTCCEPENICGTSCCDELDSCVASLSLCCGFNSPACGNKCCGTGESCLPGNNCCPNNRVCAGICCQEGSGCDLTTNTCKACPEPNTKFCSEGGGICCPLTQVCPEVPGGECCPSGQLWCANLFPARCASPSECLL